MKKRILTLTLIYDDSRILLGMKKRGFGEGRWNGFGGKVLTGEAIEAAARRELLEETGLQAGELAPRGVLTFHFEGDPVRLEIYLFSTDDITGEPRETDEMKPQWFRFTEIPYDLMWPDDWYWLPQVLAGKDVKGEFWFRDTKTLLKEKVLIQK